MSSNFKISVIDESLNDRSSTAEMESSNTIDEVMSKIQYQFDILEDQQRSLFAFFRCQQQQPLAASKRRRKSPGLRLVHDPRTRVERQVHTDSAQASCPHAPPCCWLGCAACLRRELEKDAYCSQSNRHRVCVRAPQARPCAQGSTAKKRQFARTASSQFGRI
jgi:hypothetical protein